jgi:ZIP family zinc transporter
MLILGPVLSEPLLASLFALVAGIMIYISFDELLPMAETYGKHHIALGGLLAGMLFIGVGLELL